MSAGKTEDNWNSGNHYDYYMGRWSRQAAPLFLEWLNIPPRKTWLDLGCGTGMLSEAVYRNCKPGFISCVDPSGEFLESAKEKIPLKCDFSAGSASAIPKADNTFDIVISGLSLNFFPDLSAAFREIKRVLKTGGTFAAYVWDYAGHMDFLRIFWDSAVRIDQSAKSFDEGLRFPVCSSEKLPEEFRKANFENIQSAYFDVPTVFKNFDDFWNPFLTGQGPAPGYLAALPLNKHDELKSLIKSSLLYNADGSIELNARAIAVRGIKQNG